ncbi:hypothetical protein [Winogradskyella marincola]|uniref:Uncharacterized protein n=1 Tax=Winogradskyella marincola TaxID=3037795 RepID=A0ABT6G0G0_9FLAO|nr:hypothetical protein [Winogradskyella sp. YYF002]MDG4715527.1 hypothetical protein [Winogradskyella sp. YYF002]
MTSKNQISKTPTLPLISIYKNTGIEIINKETIKYFERTSAYGLIQNSSYVEIYSSEMEILNLEQKTDKFKNTKWNRFLAKTVYNPSFDVTLLWKKIGTYKLTELKAKIKVCIEKDDDILTQFVEADFLMHKVEHSTDFTELVNNLNKYCIEVKNEEIIRKENDEWNNKK